MRAVVRVKTAIQRRGYAVTGAVAVLASNDQNEPPLTNWHLHSAMTKLYRIAQDRVYKTVDIARSDQRDFLARLSEGSDIDRALRGESLPSRWRKGWTFEPYELDSKPHPGGIGDIAMLSTLIGATNPSAANALRELLGPSAEELEGSLRGIGPISFFNVMQHASFADPPKSSDGVPFRQDPIRLHILCGEDFKRAIEQRGLTGMRFLLLRADGSVAKTNASAHAAH